MRVEVDGVRLFFDVDGPKLVAMGPWMRERPTVVLLPPRPGFDHALFKIRLGPWLAAGTQVVYLDFRGSGRSDPGRPVRERLLDVPVQLLAGRGLLDGEPPPGACVARRLPEAVLVPRLHRLEPHELALEHAYRPRRH